MDLPSFVMDLMSSVQAEAFPNGTSDYKPLRSSFRHDSKKPHISDLPMTWKNWYRHINWLNTTFILIIPMIGLISTYWVHADWRTIIFSLLYYFNCGLGITAGA